MIIREMTYLTKLTMRLHLLRNNFRQPDKIFLKIGNKTYYNDQPTITFTNISWVNTKKTFVEKK